MHSRETKAVVCEVSHGSTVTDPGAKYVPDVTQPGGPDLLMLHVMSLTPRSPPLLMMEQLSRSLTYMLKSPTAEVRTCYVIY